MEDDAGPLTIPNDEGFQDFEPLSRSSNLKYKKRTDLDSSKLTDEIAEYRFPGPDTNEQKRMMGSDRMNHLFRDRRGPDTSEQKRMMGSDRMNHLFRDRRGRFDGLFNTFSKRFQKKGSVAPWVRLYLLDHETRKNNYF